VTAVPHLSLPFAFGPDGHALENEQDGQADVAACLAALFMCPPGWRPELLDYGLDERTFALDLNTPEMVAAISRWEPRAVYLLQDEPIDADLTATVRLLLEVPQ
jgi:phage baseplate assembly protein W